MPEPATIRFLNKLERLRNKAGGGWTARCPAHKDRDPSLSIDERDGKILLKCFTGCTADAILGALGMSTADLFTNGTSPVSEPIPFRQRQSRQKPVAIYQYRDHAGLVVAEKGRFESPDGGKSFLWRPAGSEGWPGLSALSLALTDLALWGSERLTNASPEAIVYFCEGEKATQSCWDHGLTAVTFAGGASTKDFGTSLETLRGRKVALWPDNDGPGREYMALVATRLRGVAASVTTVNVPLPPKGDAYEYFAAEGTVSDLVRGAIPLNGPAVELLPDEGVRIIVPSPLGRFSFTFADIEKSARALDAELTIEVVAPGLSTDPYTERINMSSNSARSELRRDLDNVYGKELGWTKLLHTAFSLGRQHYLSQSRRIDLAAIEETDSMIRFVVHDFIPNEACTILFGDGSSLKTYLAQSLVYHVVFGLPFLGMETQTCPVLYLDYEGNEQTFRLRMKRIAQGLVAQGKLQNDQFPQELIHYIPAKGIPLRDLIPGLKRDIRETGSGLLVIDTIGPACGGRPEDAEVALAYSRAVAKLGITSLHLAHITKNGEKKGDIYYPFGSVFFNNEARRTWYITRKQEEDSDDLDIGLYCRKVNDGPKPRPFAVSAHFEGRAGPLQLSYQDIAAVADLDEQRPIKSRVWDALAGQQMTIKEIANELHVSEDKVEVAVRDKKMFTVAGKSPSGTGGGKPANLYARLDRHHTGTA